MNAQIKILKGEILTMDKGLAIKNLSAVKEVFEKFGITFWLDFGTLLGAVREGKLIEWDLDLDLATWSKDREKLLLALKNLKIGQFKAKVDVGAPLFPNCHAIHVSLFPYDSVIEIFLYHVRDDKAVNVFSVNQNFIYNIYFAVRHYLYSDIGLTVAWVREPIRRVPRDIILNILGFFLPLLPMKLKIFLLNGMQRIKIDHNWVEITPKHYFEKLDTIKFYGMNFYIPSDVEEYLKYHYGENWKIPNKKWQWGKDGKAKIYRLNRLIY
jgi:hypothetical protein